MKTKIFTAMAALVGLVACAGEVPAPVQEITINIGFSGTKAGGASDVLAHTLPTGVADLRLVSDELGVDVALRSGESVSVPVGEYSVSGSHAPVTVSCGGIELAEEPSYEVDEVLTVRNGVSQYVVNARWSCWALVLDGHESNGYLCNGVPMGLAGPVGGFYVAYVMGGDDWVLTVQPVDEDVYGMTEIEVDGSEMQAGAWYEFRAGRLWQGSGMTVEFPEWTEGE